MTSRVAEIVGQKTQPVKLLEFAQTLKDKVKLSRNEMSKHYDKWDYYDQVYRGERIPDLNDVQARKRGEPEKMILPLTFSQIQTFVAFGYSIYNQKDYMYEQTASGVEDEKPARAAEAVLEQNLHYNKFRSVGIIQFLTNIGRFGLGITKESWVNDQVPCVEEVVDQEAMAQVRPDMPQPLQPPTKRVVNFYTQYQGNKVVNISPYRWFPDPRIPLSRWDEGEFCADETEYSRTEYLKREKEGVVAGLDYVSAIPDEVYSDKTRRFAFSPKSATSPMSAMPPSHEFFVNLEVQIRLNPSKVEIDNGEFLDPDIDAELIYIVWIANDDRIVRISEAGYDHERFGYNVAQLLDDQQRFVNFSLAEVLSALQDTATWFLNAHITSVRKNVFGQAVIDPTAVEIDDIIKRRPLIRLKQGRQGTGVDSWYRQINQTDVTQQHVADVGALSGMAKEATGINETLLGQFSTGRRSAREASNVANYAAARLIMLFASIWESALGPQGEKMLSNLRQGLDVETMVKIYGIINTQEMAQPDLPGLPPPLYRLIKVTKADLIGNYDMVPFNGTTPSSRQQAAAVLENLLEKMQANPQLVMLLGLDPKLIALEVLQLLNIRNVQRFQLTPERLQQLTQMAQPPGNAGGPVGPQGATPGVGAGQP